MGGTVRTSETKIEALTLQSSVYGAAVPVVGGASKVPVNLLDYLNFKDHPRTEEQGGKGGGVESTTYTYSVSALMGLARGQCEVGNIWKGKEVLERGYSFTPAVISGSYSVPSSGAMEVSNSGFSKLFGDLFVTYSSGGKLAVLSSGFDYKVDGGKLVILRDYWRGKSISYTGTWATSTDTHAGLSKLGMSIARGLVSQSAPAWLESEDADKAVSYPGLAYVHAQDYDLGNSSSVENHSFEVFGFGAYEYGSSKPDCNTAKFVSWLLTESDFGAGIPAERLDVGQWVTYVQAAGLLSSPALTTQIKAADLLKRACELTNSIAVNSYDRIRIRPLADVEVTGNGATYTPDNTIQFDLNDDWYLGPVQWNRKQASDRYNHFRVEYKDRANYYSGAIAEAFDDADIALHGKRTSPDTISAPWVCDGSVARLIAQIELQRSLNINATGSVTLPFAFCMLEPGDLVTITDTRMGINKLPVRVTATNGSGGRVTIEFEEWPLGVASPAVYSVEVPGGFLHNYNAAPGNVDAPVIFEGPAQLASPTGVEVFVAARGINQEWGGCHVWVSYDGTEYKQIGTIFGDSRYGLLNGSMSSGATSFNVDGLLDSVLLNGSAADATALETLCFIGGSTPEFLAYQTATLTGSGAYTISGLVRGAYQSGANSHADNTPFVRMDGTPARSGPLDASMVGKTIYVKCLSFNIYNRATQSLADATAYAYTITGKPAGYLPGIAGKALALDTDSFTFQYPKAGGVNPGTITLTAARKGGLVGGAVSWSVIAGTATLTGSGDTRTLTAGNLGSDTATIRASVTDEVAAYTADVTISKVREGADGDDGDPGADGADGGYIDYRFKRSATAPSTPTGDTPAGWSDGPPAGTDPLYFIKGAKTAAGVLVGVWSTPARLDGESTVAEYSEDGVSGWHSTATATDKYMRTKTGDGAWQGPFRIVAEDAGPVSRAIPKIYAEHSAINPATATAGIRFKSDGRMQTRSGSTWVDRMNWHYPTTTGIGSGWHIRRTHIGGTVPSGGGTMTAGTWLALTSDRDVLMSQTADGNTNCNELFELSADGGATVYASGDGVVSVTRTTEA